MKAYQHILLTTDFSKVSEAVAQKAVNLAGHFNARITLLHVIEHFPEDAFKENGIALENVETGNYLLAENRRRLEDFARSIPNAQVIPMVSLSKDNTDDEIIKIAKEIKADLIIIGKHGENNVSVLLGPNEKTLEQKAPCDVLVVHADAA